MNKDRFILLIQLSDFIYLFERIYESTTRKLSILIIECQHIIKIYIYIYIVGVLSLLKLN